MSNTVLYQITAPHFCTGVIVGIDDTVVDAAPILRWLIGRSISWLQIYCKRKGWKMTVIL